MAGAILAAGVIWLLLRHFDKAGAAQPAAPVAPAPPDTGADVATAGDAAPPPSTTSSAVLSPTPTHIEAITPRTSAPPIHAVAVRAPPPSLTASLRSRMGPLTPKIGRR